MKKLFKWTLRLALAVVVATAIARIVAKVSADDGPGGSSVIGGDTWPPVPTNRQRD